MNTIEQKEIKTIKKILNKILTKKDKIKISPEWEGLREYYLSSVISAIKDIIPHLEELERKDKITYKDTIFSIDSWLRWPLKSDVSKYASVLTGNEVSTLLGFIAKYRELINIKSKFLTRETIRSGKYYEQLENWLKQWCTSYEGFAYCIEYTFENKENLELLINRINQHILCDMKTPSYYLSCRNSLAKIRSNIEKNEGRRAI